MRELFTGVLCVPWIQNLIMKMAVSVNISFFSSGRTITFSKKAGKYLSTLPKILFLNLHFFSKFKVDETELKLTHGFGSWVVIRDSVLTGKVNRRQKVWSNSIQLHCHVFVHCDATDTASYLCTCLSQSIRIPTHRIAFFSPFIFSQPATLLSTEWDYQSAASAMIFFRCLQMFAAQPHGSIISQQKLPHIIFIEVAH